MHEVCVRRTWHGMCCLRTYLPATARSRCVCFVCTIDRVIHFASPVHHAQRRISVARLLTAGKLALAGLQCVYRIEPRPRQVSASRARLATQVMHIIAYLHDFDEQYTRYRNLCRTDNEIKYRIELLFGP